MVRSGDFRPGLKNFGGFRSGVMTFIQSRRGLIANGYPAPVVLGSPDADVSAALRPSGNPTASQPVSTWVGHTTSGMLANHKQLLATRLAAVLIVQDLLRWQILPTEDNYCRIPEWYRPIPAQRKIPHDALIDYIPWPFARDYLIKNPAAFVVGCFSPSISFDWPYSEDDIFCCDSSTGERKISPVFIKSVRDLNNWSVRALVFDLCPALKERIPLATSQRVSTLS